MAARASGFGPAEVLILASTLAGGIWWGLDGVAYGVAAGFTLVVLLKMLKIW